MNQFHNNCIFVPAGHERNILGYNNLPRVGIEIAAETAATSSEQRISSELVYV